MFLFPKLFFLSPDHKFSLWSQIRFFQGSKWKIQKMDIYKCPKLKIQKNFPIKNLIFSSTSGENKILAKIKNSFTLCKEKRGFIPFYFCFFVILKYIYL